MNLKGFKNSYIYVEGKGICKSNLEVENGVIKSFEAKDDFIELGNEFIVVPGFIDKHIHGANNSDSMYPTIEDITNISKTILKEGVTTYLATTMTQSLDNIKKALENINNYIKNYNTEGAFVLGIHLEGPFISKKHKGAQKEEYIIPCCVETFKMLNEVSGNNIKQVTLAYEENGENLTKYLYESNIVASIGHTDATSNQVLEGAKVGLTSATHAYNAMKGLHHREAGCVGGIMLSEDIFCEVICDFVHVSKNALKILYDMKTQDKITLITDALEAKHLKDGIYNLGGQEVTVLGKEARLKDGTLAGSTLKMNEAIINAQSAFEISLEKAIDLATINPARVLKIDDKKGSINIGKDADLVVINKDLEVFMTIVGGKVLYKKENFYE